ncbi:MAG: class I tRNA ligase family protein [Saprospiraceae bacterium]
MLHLYCRLRFGRHGTGAVMAVPSGDQRDWDFATHFGLPIVPILDAQENMEEAADATKEGRYINSGMINGLTYEQAMPKLIDWLEERGLGRGKSSIASAMPFSVASAIGGSPFLAYWKDGVPYLIEERIALVVAEGRQIPCPPRPASRRWAAPRIEIPGKIRI